MMLRYISSQSRPGVTVTENVELYFQQTGCSRRGSSGSFTFDVPTSKLLPRSNYIFAIKYL